MLNIRQITDPADHTLAALCALLTDVVHGGASVNFLAPLDPEIAAGYWESVFAQLGPGLVLWVAEEDGETVGSVQLALCWKPNGVHRAEVMKLIVSSRHRGRGIASRLMAELETFARAGGRTLLHLDTEAGSPAEIFYQRLGWTRIGEIPDYAASTDGVLMPSAFYYKRLTPLD